MPFQLEDARREISEGLRGTDKARRDRAWKARSFYERRNEQYLTKRREELPEDFEERIKAYRLLTYRAVRALSRHLYTPGPVRQVEGVPDVVQQFLGDVWKANAINELMAEADRLASLGGACLIEVHPTRRPEKPIKLYLYGADECRVWCEPEDPGAPVAVCTVQRLTDHSTRYDLWTAEQHEVWIADPNTSGGVPVDARDSAESYVPTSQPKLRSDLSGENSYGVIPFAAAHDELPISDFFGCGGIGWALARSNQALDEKISDLMDAVSKFHAPMLLARNVGTKFRFRFIRGLIQHLVGDKDSILNPEAGDPDVWPVQAQVDFQAGWDDIDRFVDGVLDDVECPRSAVKLGEAASAPSGIAQLVASLPLRERAVQRRGPFGRTEQELVRIILGVASAHDGGKFLKPFIDKAELTLTWPAIATPLPMPEIDQADQWLMDQGLKSRLMVLQDRYGLTHDQAVDHMKKVAEDLKEEIDILGPEDPQQVEQPGQPGEQPGEKPAAKEEAPADGDA